MMLAYKQQRECEKCVGNTDKERERERERKKGCTIMISEGRGLTSMEKDEGGQRGQIEL